MNLVRQPRDSTCSGQAVVAMLLHVELETAIKLMGKRGMVSAQEIVRILREREIKVGDRRVPTRGEPLPPSCIAYARWPFKKSGGRWLLRWKGVMFDPAAEWVKEDVIYSSYILLG